MADFLFDDIYNAIVTRMGVVYPDHVRIDDPYELENNKDLKLIKGWGLSIGPPGGENANRYINLESINIDLNVVFTRKAYALEGDPASRATKELELINDFELLYTEIHDNNFGLTALGYGLADLVDFSGIIPVKNERSDYIALTATVSIKYNRNS